MPTNLYGPNDNYDLKTSHVLPALIRKFHEAKISNKDVELWGSGIPLRDFLHVDDLADAVLFIMNNQKNEFLYNIGSGTEISIDKLAKLIKEKNKIDIKPSMIQPIEEIKSLGKFKVRISLHSEVDAEIIVNVSSTDTIQ